MTVHDAWATLFAYPGGTGRDDVLAALRALPSAARADLAPFAAFLAEHDATELEETYTRTFDINPVCTLEVGWHLYGEDYSRGAFLVQMRERLRALGVPETTELPDHITSVLAVLGRLDDADAFARGQVLPAVNKMLDGFRRDDDPYRVLVTALRDWLRARYGAETAAPAAMVPPPYACGGCGGGGLDG